MKFLKSPLLPLGASVFLIIIALFIEETNRHWLLGLAGGAMFWGAIDVANRFFFQDEIDVD